MANLPAEVTSFKIGGHILRGIADTVGDVDTTPESVALNAYVKFTPTLNKPTTLLPSGDVILVSEVRAEVDQNGNIRPPADGHDADWFDPSGDLWLISPSSPGLLDQGWSWSAHFYPKEGEDFKEFVIHGIAGSSGETVTLTTASVDGGPGWSQVIFYEVTTLSQPWPSGYRPGIDYLLLTNTSPMQLWKDK